MATYYLLNTISLGTAKYFPGDFLNSAIDPTAAIAAAGGMLWPSSDATVAAQAVLVANKRKSKAPNEQELESLMFASASNSLLGQTSAPLSDTNPLAVGTAADPGVSTSASRYDHVHALAAATTTTQGAQSAADKIFEDNLHSAAGTGLTDTATQTIQPSGGYWRKLATLGQGGTLTLGTTNAVAGDQWTITRNSTDAFTYAIVNGGTGAGTLVTMPASKKNFAVFQFDGTDWALRAIGTQ